MEEQRITHRQALEFVFPRHVEQIIEQHPDRSPEVVMQQLLDNMYPQDVQQALFGEVQPSLVASSSTTATSGVFRRHNSVAATSSTSKTKLFYDGDAVEAALEQGWNLAFPTTTEFAFGYWMTQAQTKTDEFASTGA